MAIDKGLKQEVLNEYCMEQLQEIVVEQADDLDRAAFTVALVICYAHDDIDELKLDLYLSSIKLDRDDVIKKLKWFAGAGFIKVDCLGHEFGGECLKLVIHDMHNDIYIEGETDLKHIAERYTMVKDLIQGFRTMFWDTDPNPDDYTEL